MLPVAAPSSGGEGSNDRATLLRRNILEFGWARFGRPPDEIRTRIGQIEDVGYLEATFERVVSVANWQSLLE